MHGTTQQSLDFKGFTLDLLRGSLRRGQNEVKLRPKSFELLRYLVENPGRLICKEELIRAVWADAFVTDNSLVQCLIEIRRGLGDDAQTIIRTVPRRGYIFDVPVKAGEGTKLKEASEAEQAIPSVPNGRQSANSALGVAEIGPASGAPDELSTRPRSKLTAWLSLLLGIALIASGLLWKLVAMRAGTPAQDALPKIQSIAILPLINLSHDQDQEYFADAMTEALTTELGKLSSLRVISRTSAMRYKQTTKGAPEIGRELNVDAVVEGSIQRSGDRVAITAQLIYAPEDRHLWAQSYEHDLRDVLSMQREVAEQIAYEVQAKIVPHGSRPSAHKVNPEAYEDYVLGRYAWETRSKESLFRALTYFQRAIDKDPDFALAYSGEAEACISLAVLALISPPEYLERARVAATKAVALDESLAEAHNALAAVLFNQYRWQDSEREYKRAIELNPNYATAHLWYGFLLEALGQQSANLAERKLAHELDPLNFTASGAVGTAYYFLGDYDRAIAEYKRALELNPEFSMTRADLGEAYLAKRMYPEAIAEFTKAGALGNLGYAYAVSGNRAKAREILSKLNEESKYRYVSPASQALVLVGLGENDEAITWLEKAERENVALHHLNVDPAFIPLRENPRFQQLLQRLGLTR